MFDVEKANKKLEEKADKKLEDSVENYEFEKNHHTALVEDDEAEAVEDGEDYIYTTHDDTGQKNDRNNNGNNDNNLNLNNNDNNLNLNNDNNDTAISGLKNGLNQNSSSSSSSSSFFSSSSENEDEDGIDRIMNEDERMRRNNQKILKKILQKNWKQEFLAKTGTSPGSYMIFQFFFLPKKKN